MRHLILGMILLSFLTSCSRTRLVEPVSVGPTAQIRPDPSVVARPAIPLRRLTKGEALYIRYCADCHGWEGQGDGPVAASLGVTPPPLQRTALFARATEDELIAWILLGKGLTLPLTQTAFPQTEAEVTTLVGHLRSLPTIPWQLAKEGQGGPRHV